MLNILFPKPVYKTLIVSGIETNSGDIRSRSDGVHHDHAR